MLLSNIGWPLQRADLVKSPYVGRRSAFGFSCSRRQGTVPDDAPMHVVLKLDLLNCGDVGMVVV